MVKKERVLFLCTYNSARSQMAEGILCHLASDRYEVKSAGTHPCEVDSYAVKVMDEIGIDISRQYPKSVLNFINEKFDYVITLCDSARETCPLSAKGKNIHWSLADPGRQAKKEEEFIFFFRKTRNILKALIMDFIKDSLAKAYVKCPLCKKLFPLDIPEDKCQAFYKCPNCGRIISAQRASCCLICSYSDKVCREFLTDVLINKREN